MKWHGTLIQHFHTKYSQKNNGLSNYQQIVTELKALTLAKASDVIFD